MEILIEDSRGKILAKIKYTRFRKGVMPKVTGPIANQVRKFLSGGKQEIPVPATGPLAAEDSWELKRFDPFESERNLLLGLMGWAEENRLIMRSSEFK
jgi:hypothetical protein